MSEGNGCKRCNNPVGTGLKCRTCGTVSHRSCLKTIKAKFIDDSTVDCCTNLTVPIRTADNTSTNINIDVEKNVEQIRITYLEEIIRQKDLLIDNQGMLINSLQAQISLLNQQVSPQVVNALATVNASSYAKVVSDNMSKALHKEENASIQNQKPNTSRIKATTVSHAIHTAQTSKLCQDIVNLTKDVQVNSKRNPHNLLIGKAESAQQSTSFKAAKYTKFNHFHITNCDPATTKEALSSYLTEIVPEVQVEVLSSRNPTYYSSFKISVPSSEAPKILKEEVWPSGVVVNKFFLPKRQSNYTKNPEHQ